MFYQMEFNLYLILSLANCKHHGRLIILLTWGGKLGNTFLWIFHLGTLLCIVYISYCKLLVFFVLLRCFTLQSLLSYVGYGWSHNKYCSGLWILCKIVETVRLNSFLAQCEGSEPSPAELVYKWLTVKVTSVADWVWTRTHLLNPLSA